MTKEELGAIFAYHQLEYDQQQTFIFGDLLADRGVDTLRENLHYFLTHLGGSQKAIAEELGVREETIWKWKNRDRVSVPQPRNLEKLRRHLGLESVEDLTQRPLFLSYDPVGVHEQRRWLLERIKQLSPSELTRHFESLRKILS